MQKRIHCNSVLSALAVVAVLLSGGCVSSPRTDPGRDQVEQEQIESRLKEVFDAAEKKDLDRLDSYHLYGPAFTKFTTERSDRLNAEETRKGEHEALISVSGLKMRADELKIDVFDRTAVATFILNYGFTSGGETVQKKTRSTLVFVKDHGAWKIVHEHFSAI